MRVSGHRVRYAGVSILEIADEYLIDIHRKHFWGYSLPYYVSACNNCHPNYALFLSRKQTLTVKSLNEIMQTMPIDVRQIYSKDAAERYYEEYMENYVNDSEAIGELARRFSGKTVLVLGPGRSIRNHEDRIRDFVTRHSATVVSLNFIGDGIAPQYVFSSNMRRYVHLQDRRDVIRVVTSNMKDVREYDFLVNFSSYRSRHADIIDNSAVMALRLLSSIGMKSVAVAGLDGYGCDCYANYYDDILSYDFSETYQKRNEYISDELRDINDRMKLNFLTPTRYSLPQGTSDDLL